MINAPQNAGLIMRLSLILTCLLTVNLSASVFSQQNRVTLELQEASLEELIVAIKKQCDVGFIYDYNTIRGQGNISIKARDEELGKVLERALAGTGFFAEIEHNTIILKKSREIPAAQESVVIRGTVKDQQGAPLPGVTILIKGTTLGTSSDKDGRFELRLPDPAGITLVFTFIGMESAVITLKDDKPLQVVLKELTSEVEEVVVTGIYSRNKESFTGSSTTYQAKELKMVGNMNILQSLKTLDPSFAVIENNLYGSDPNRMPEININGQSSIKALHSEYDQDPNAPLFILDGFETTLEVINDLSMDRIESITLLKDAASTAIYGSKAANGVVVVETKSPTAGKLRVNYNGAFSVAWADLSDYNLMNAAEKLEFERLSGFYGYYDETNGFFVSEAGGRNYYRRLAEVQRGVDTYWLHEPLRVAFTQGHTLFVEGGDNTLRYSIGASYRNTQGVMDGSNRDALNGNIRLIYRFKTLSFTNYTNIDAGNAISENATFSDFSRANPYYRKHNEFGQVTKVLEDFDGEYVYNPLYDVRQNSLNRDRSFSFKNNFQIEWRIFPELSLRGRFSLTKENNKGLNFASPNLIRFAEQPLTDRGTYSETHVERMSYDGDATITFGKVYKEVHLLNAVAGMNFRSSSSTSSGYSVKGFLTDRFDNPAFSNGYPAGGRPNYSETETRSASYYLNAGYSYANRYLLDANFRMDGTSVFGANNLFTKTWAVGVGWNVHNEPFLAGNEVLSYLKLRFSIGNPGNQNLDAKMANNAYNYVTSYPNPFGLAALVSTWGNKDLDWQKTLNANYGIDLEILKRRFKISVDYYNKKTDPQIVSIDLPPSTGSGSMPVNLGGLRSYGLTASASYYIFRKKEMTWSVNANLRHAVSEYYKIGDALSQYENEAGNASNRLMRFYDGQTTTALYAVLSAGIDPATGREVFIRKDGTPTYTYYTNDQVKVGDSTPKVEGVVGSSFYYKGFSCSINFRYRHGGQIFLNTLYEKVENISEEGLRKNQDKRALYDRWKKPGDPAKFKAINLTDSTPISSRFVEDENTFSCESFSVNYESQAPWLKTAGISSLTLSASTSDIFRISTVKNERGLDFPFQRSVNFTVGVRF